MGRLIFYFFSEGIEKRQKELRLKLDIKYY